MAYTTATIVQKDPPGADGRTRIVVEFTGGGEVVRRAEKYVENETIADLRAWTRTQATALAGRTSIAGLLTVGATLDLTPPAGPTAAEIARDAWLADAARLKRATDLGLTNATAVADIAALRTTVNANYLSAYLGRL